MSIEDKVDGGIRILSCDSGGPGVYSQLLLIRELTARIAHDLEIDESGVYPADYFDLMGGVGFGGIVAFMLGYLRMNVEDAIDAVVSIATAVFRPEAEWKRDPDVNTNNLKEAIENLLVDKRIPIDMRMSETVNEGDPRPCKVALYATTTDNVNQPIVLSTYASRSSGFNPTIVEALCATVATPPLFSPVKMGPYLMEQSFVGGGLGVNNPTQELLKEASRVFGTDRRLAQIISLGSGVPKAISLNTSRNLEDVNRLLEDVMADCEMVAHELSTRLTRAHPYLRLNVNRGMENLAIKDWEQLGTIECHTKAYVDNPHIMKAIDLSLVPLKGRFGISTLGEINHLTTDKATAENRFYINPKKQRDAIFDSLFQARPSGTSSPFGSSMG